MIYFDHNATTPIDERVAEAMQPFSTSFYGNASALYRIGRLARSAVETAREHVAALVDVSPTQVVFTSGGTEANNLALQAVAQGSRMVVSEAEHPSIIEPAKRLQRIGVRLEWLGIERNGLIDPDSFEWVKMNRPSFVSIMLANNETGVVQDIARWAGVLRENRVLVHTDAVQAVGKIPVSFKKLNVQFMSLSAHKLYGPKGCGALILEQGLTLEPMLLGGGQERGLRAGTENVAAIVGFGKAAELAIAELEQRNARLLQLRRQLERGLKELPGAVIFSENATRLPNTVQFAIPGTDGEMLQMQLDKKDIAVSSGSACASAGGQPSPVLTAMGIAPDLAKGAIRVSLGQSNTKAEIAEFIAVLKSLISEQ
ncbi:MAG: cysteine desulfurase family protein [Gammaproteobacteria bacterium]